MRALQYLIDYLERCLASIDRLLNFIEVEEKEIKSWMEKWSWFVSVEFYDV